MLKKNNITGIILAGGKSSRMGCDKGLIYYKGQPFLKYIINALNPLVSKIIIVSNNEDYDKFNLQRLPDLISDSGPLAGLYTGLKHSQTKYNLVLSCDVPLINSDVLKLLINAYETTIDVVQLECQNKTMPLIALYKKDCLESIKIMLDNKEKRMRKALEIFKVKTLKLEPQWDYFLKNINTKEDLKTIL